LTKIGIIPGVLFEKEHVDNFCRETNITFQQQQKER